MNKSALRKQYKSLYSELEAILFRIDPMKLDFGDNTDEYSPEVGTILPRLRGTNSVDGVRVIVIVIEEFVRWFGEDGDESAITPSLCDQIALEIGEAWQRFLAT